MKNELFSMDLEKGKFQVNLSGMNSLMIMLGGVLTFSGILTLLSITAVMFVSGSFRSFLQLAVMGLVILPAGIMLLYYGTKIRKREQQINLLTGILQSYRRIKLDAVSGKMKININETERLIAFALSLDMIKGFIDRNTEEFVLESAGGETSYCRSCGAPFGKVYLKGESVRCSSCGTAWTV